MVEDNMPADVQGEELKELPGDAVAGDSATRFLNSLSNYFEKDELKLHFRVVEDGLFVEELYCERLLEAYQKWLQQVTGSESLKSIRKCKRRLFGTEHPELRYLREGKLSKVGFLLAAQFQNPHSLGLTLYRGCTLAANDYLQPGDPVFEELKNVELKIGASGISVEIAANRELFKLNMEALQQIASVIHPPRRGRDDSVKAAYALRDVVVRLSKLLPKMRLLSKKAFLIVPQAFVKERFFRLGTLVVVVDKESNVLSSYGLSGRSFRRFIGAELSKLGAAGKNQQPKGFRLIRGKRGILGSLYREPRSYLVHREVLFELLDGLPRIKPRFDKLAPRHTVRDILQILVKMFEAGEDCSHLSHAQKKVNGLSVKWEVRNVKLLVNDKNELAGMMVPGVKKQFKNEHKYRTKPQKTTKRSKRY